MPGLSWNQERRVVFLGDVASACKTTPTGLDRQTLKAYAEKCGTEVALKWASDELGVNVSGCSSDKAQKAAECVANNYGITLDVIDKDGNVNWDNVVRDAGAVGGIAICAATGAGAAALTICGKIGAEIGKVVGAIVKGVGKAIIDVWFGGDDGGGIACEKSPGGVGVTAFGRDLARYMRSGPIASAKADQLLGGPILAGFNAYWDRVLQINGLAQASGAIIAEVARQAGSSPAAAARAMNIVAPPGWTELVRPLFGPVQKDSVWPDFIMNLGGLLAVMYDPRLVTEKDIIKTAWQKPEFWNGVEPAAAIKPPVWYYFVDARECPNHVVNWGRIDNYDLAKQQLAQKGGTETSEFDWWIYSIPKSIDDFIRNTPDPQFKVALDLWKTSISSQIPQKIARAKSSSAAGGTSLAPLAIGGGIVALLIWLLL